MTSKVTAILMTFTGGSTYSLTEIARLAGLPVSTTHRLASELTAWRILERAPDGGYRVGLPLRMIGAERSHAPTLQERAPHVMDDLAAATGSSVRFGVLRGLQVAYIEKRDKQPVSAFAAGATLPAHATAVGKALLAFTPARTVDRIVANGLTAYTPYTLTRPDRLRRALAVTRLSRMAVSRWELQMGTSAVAMPVFGVGGDVVAALEASVEELREVAGVRAALAVAAGSLSREVATGSADPCPANLSRRTRPGRWPAHDPGRGSRR